MEQPKRKNIRFQGFDYRSLTAYFVTVCTHDRQCVFGTIDSGILKSSRRGLIAAECWKAIPTHNPHVELDNFIVMPNHVHGILRFVGATHASSAAGSGPPTHSLGAVIGSYKAAVSKMINRLRPAAAISLWQRSYYDHVIRHDRAYELIWQYTDDNPRRWGEDAENPLAVRPMDMAKWLDGLVCEPDDACVAPTKS